MIDGPHWEILSQRRITERRWDDQIQAAVTSFDGWLIEVRDSRGPRTISLRIPFADYDLDTVTRMITEALR